MNTGFWLQDIKEGNHLGRPRRRWDGNIKMERIMCFYRAHSRHYQDNPTVCGLRLFCLHVATISFVFLILSITGDIFSSIATSVFILQPVQMCSAVFLIYFICAAVITFAILALLVQLSLQYNRVGLI